jgi:uncharacterized protein YbbC (DUF1343 family)
MTNMIPWSKPSGRDFFMHGKMVRQVLECASPLALWRSRKRQRTAALSRTAGLALKQALFGSWPFCAPILATELLINFVKVAPVALRLAIGKYVSQRETCHLKTGEPIENVQWNAIGSMGHVALPSPEMVEMRMCMPGRTSALIVGLCVVIGLLYLASERAWAAGNREISASSVLAKSNAEGVWNGIDSAEHEGFKMFRGLRIGLITNHTGKDRQGRSTIDLFWRAPEVKLAALFSPEHGIRGDRDEKIGHDKDATTGLPIYSLYGEHRRPQIEQLRGLDALVFDIQDIGCRFYTYISTMGLAMEAAAQAGLKFYVLDRINPIGGQVVDGPMLLGQTNFTAFHPIPVRHGMTVGELARLYAHEQNLKLDLTVVPLHGWRRSFWQDQTGLPWINPSPNMRNLTAAALYPGIGLLETTELSVGRGTDRPFETVGAPFIEEHRWSQELNSAKLAGIRFEPIRFTPTASVSRGQSCGGVRLIITDRARCNPFEVALTMARSLHEKYPDRFTLAKMNTLLVHPPTLDALRAGTAASKICRSWKDDLQAFRERRKACLLYR